MAHRSEHQQQTQGVTDEAGYADHDAAGEHHYAIEEFAGRNFTLGESVVGPGQHPETNPLDEKWAQNAHADQKQHRPSVSDVRSHGHERGDFSYEEQGSGNQEHHFRVPPPWALFAGARFGRYLPAWLGANGLGPPPAPAIRA